MKKLFLIWFLSIFNISLCLSQSKVYKGDKYITSQTDLETLKGYTKIIGNLFLYGEKNPEDEITDLSPLAKLETIVGNLQIITTQISDFKGLENLKTIKGDTYISYNYKLLSTSSLSLTNIKSFTFSNSPMLLSLSLKTLKEVTSLNINNNNFLKRIELENLTATTSNFLISSNNHLEELSFPALTSVGGMFRISENKSLSDCCIFNSLLSSEKGILGNIDISENKKNCNTKEEVLDLCR